MTEALHLFFYEQPVHKQLVLEWQIAKQLSGLNLLSLSNNENYRLKKSGVFHKKRKIAVKPTINQNLAVSKALLGNFKSNDHEH